MLYTKPPEKPIVTIFLSSYNHADYLRYSIDSVLAQSFSNFELIIYDDCSSDNSWEIIQSYTDARIKAFRSEENKGRDSFLPLFNLAKGKYIARQHCDDIWEQHKLLKQVEFLESNSEYAAVFTHVQAIDIHNKVIPESFASVFEQPNRTRFEWLRVLFTYNPFCHPSVLLRKEQAAEIYLTDAEYICNIDQIFWIKLCLKNNVHVLQEKLTYFRIQEKNTNDGGNNQANMNSLFNETHFMLDYYKHLNSPEDFIRVFPESCKYIVNSEMIPNYALAQICLQHPHVSYYHFGLNLLFKVMSSYEGRKKVKELYKFTQRDLKKLSGSRNVYTGALNVQEEGAVDHVAQIQVISESGVGKEGVLTMRHRIDHHIPFGLYFDLNAWRDHFPNEKIKALLFSPTQEAYYNCRITHCTLNDVQLDIKPVNAVYNHKGKDIFSENRPLYRILIAEQASRHIKIEGTLTN